MRTHDLAPGEIVIGRGAECDLRIDHPTLSRRHVVVRRRGDRLTVQDLGSTNGTRIGADTRRGGEPVALAPGESFHVGPFTFVALRTGAEADGSASGVARLRVIDPTPDGVPALVREAAATTTSLLVLGETGTGKEVLAETLHALSGRRGPLVRINCATLAEALLESELFGHEKGAFTGAVAARAGLLESAAGGTVFLDEIGELPPGVQAKLLRAVEQREVVRLGSVRPLPIDVRFLAATNRDLPAEVAAGRFRRDLYFRLDGLTLVIPPLRERRERIGSLALQFLAGRARLRADVLAALEAHPWTGNVRELKAVIDRAVLLARGGDPEVRHLVFLAEPALAAPAPPAASAAPAPPVAPAAIPGELSAAERAERAEILRVLDACGGNQTRAARELGIARSTLVAKLRLYRIRRPRG